MKKYLLSLLSLFASLVAIAQTPPDTSTFEKKARYDISRIRDNTVRAITPKNFRDAFGAVADLAVHRVPYLTVSDLRSGQADTARVVQVVKGGRAFQYSYDPSSTAADDSVNVIRNGTRRYLLSSPLSPEFFADGNADDTQEVNKALAENQPVYLYRDYIVTTLDNKYGVPFLGPGRIMKQITGGLQQLTSHSDDSQYIFGKEYLYALLNKALTRTAGTTITGSLIGDSTTSGVGVTTPYRLNSLMNSFLGKDGIANVTINNLGISSESLTHWRSAVLTNSYIDALGDFVFMRWGVNEPAVDRTVDQYLDDLDAALASIRARKPVTATSIIIVSPNAVSDTPNKRDEKWMEAISSGTKRIARKYSCAYLDIYSMFRDARNPAAAGYMWDDPYADGRGIHPTNPLNVLIATEYYNLAFPEGYRKLIGASGTGTISNLLNTARIVTGTDLPSTFTSDININRAQGTGLAYDGMITTIKSVDQMWLQIHNPYLAADKWKVPYIRFSSGYGGGAWGSWIAAGVNTPTRVEKEYAPADADNVYPVGITVSDVTTAAGWPVGGRLMTTKDANGAAKQELTSTTSAAHIMYERSTYYNGSTSVWTPWSISGEMYGSATFDAPSIAAGSYVTTTATVTGVQFGKVVSVATSVDLGNDILVFARPTGTNTCTITIRNIGTAAVDPASAAYYLTVDL